jgi:hypothetical protein
VLPLSRNRTYDTSTPVHPGDINDVQDAIIAAKHGELEIPIAAIEFVASVPANVSPGADGSLLTSGAVTLYKSVQLPVGVRVKSFRVTANGNGTVDITTAQVWRRNAPAVSVSLGSTAINNVGASVETTIDLTDYTLVSGDVIVIQLTINATGCTIDRATLVIDKP